MNLKKIENNLCLDINKSELNLLDTLDCGQSFRFKQLDSGIIEGIAFNKVLRLSQEDDKIIIYNSNEDDFKNIWEDFFDLKTDYVSIKESFKGDDTLNKALEYASGIRILKQDSLETLISFIISQNNNIPRIKGSINKLCEKFGEKIEEGYYSFPNINVLASLEKSDLAEMSLGYRDDYIIDAARKIYNKEIDINNISKMSIEEAREELRKIKGVGPKVAECVLLFGFYRVEAFPVDTWIKKALAYFYKDGFPKEYTQYAGIAQQFIFHYIRTCKEAIPQELRK